MAIVKSGITGLHPYYDDTNARFDIDGAKLRLQDSDDLEFGDASDVVMRWDGTDLDIIPAADDSVLKIGDGTSSMDVWVYGNTSDDNIIFDASGKILNFDGVDLMLEDSDILYFGDASDVQVRWDGTDLDIIPVADDSVVKFGNGTSSFDVWVYGNTSDDNIIHDASGNIVNFDGIDLMMEDADILYFGDASDVQMRWDGTDFDVLPVADDSVFKFGNGTLSFDVWVYGNTTDDYVRHDASANNLDLLGAMDLRIANIGTFDLAAQNIGTATFTVTGLTSNDVVILSPREATDGAIVVDMVAADVLTIRNVASEAANVEMNYYVLAKAS